MVDVSSKPVSSRSAVACGWIKLKRETIRLIQARKVEKGDPLEAAKLAGIMAAKNTWNTLPLCHQIPLKSVAVDVQLTSGKVVVTCRVKADYVTGVEMEAIHATMVALLTVWDMTKQYEKNEAGEYPSTEIGGVRVLSKTKTSMGD
ncbi:MAG: cyclic pyranopterin monophosphate synthase MoaC [Thermoprotei archaeon]